MERTTPRSLVVAPQESSLKTHAQPPKLRKKLQKSVTKQRNFTSSISLIRGRLKQKQRQQPCLLPALTPDLNDSKWSDYLLRETGCFCPKTSTTRASSLLLPPRPEESEPLLQEKPSQIIPELSHLAISNAKHHNPDNNNNSSSDSASSPMTPRDNQALRRRRAKTPIFSIGQLESIPRPGNALATNEKRLSAEVMAEQYRALIASRNSILKETHSEPSHSRLGHRDEDGFLLDDENGAHHQPRDMNLLPPEVPLPNGSPTTSDDGTLVGFEEETVYFKPVSFSPEPLSPDFEDPRFQSPLPHQMPGNLSLQICLDLLTRDLSSGLKGAGLGVNTASSSNNTSALQVWVMIEAYERLKDQLFFEASNFLAALEATEARVANSRPPQPQRLQQPQPQNLQQRQPQPRIQQPTPQRLDKDPPSGPNAAATPGKIVQPTPQALPTRSSGSSILVSPRQKGNPVLACLKSMPWEYSDIPADYGLGLTTCALFLSLKYHRLHPEYIYTRIRNLQGKYNLRILLTMVDIPNHEDSLRELSKTSVVNNVTVILCWSAAEAARYLELYKSYEHASFAAIRGQQATGYAEKLVEFVTVPRAINKADAVALVSTFGSLRHAVNADPEQVSIVGGWGERKVKAWCKAVEQPFRVKKAAKRKAGSTQPQGSAASRNVLDDAIPLGRVPRRDMVPKDASATAGTRSTGPGGSRKTPQERSDAEALDADDEEALIAAAMAEETANSTTSRREPQSSAQPSGEGGLSEGIAAALAKLRNTG
ncbi:hypothetical protein V8F20_010492 [Naviculisporaceae sp. PSN 640]